MNKLSNSYLVCRDIFKKNFYLLYLVCTLLSIEKFKFICSLYSLFYYLSIENHISIYNKELISLYKKLKSSDHNKSIKILKNYPIVFIAFFETINKLQIDEKLFTKIIEAIEIINTNTTYNTYEDLEIYLNKISSIIAELMVRILSYKSNQFVYNIPQLKKFLQKLIEGIYTTTIIQNIFIDRNRNPPKIYIPKVEQEWFETDLTDITNDYTNTNKNLIKFELEKCQNLYKKSDLCVNIIDLKQKPAIKLLKNLFQNINTKIEKKKYDVYTHYIELSNFDIIKCFISNLSIFDLFSFTYNFIHYNFFFN